MLMPYQVTMVPNYLVADRLGLLDTRWAIWLPAFSHPFRFSAYKEHEKDTEGDV